ncbi:uncharacterized protein LOC128740226 [Sabethes cyaneus]|uniref:uncharacterized protein LOC128740226 n=1 Tax=Sabethes cyaneus TaxID=53552 RepID=UPI00237DB7A2|nr:uncharacterized protein LOC128740226 [Sabethes cyaneus]
MFNVSYDLLADYLSLATDVEAKEEEIGPSNCLCNGPSCICCIEFNMSYIDLGGPGCVRLKYLSVEEGIALNVSYGDSVLHSQRVKGPDPAPTCLNMFARLAQMCARFSELLPTDDGLRGCLQLEPMLLGEVQIELPLGCFRMGPKGVELIKSSEEEIKEQHPQESIPDTTPQPPTGEKKAEDEEPKPVAAPTLNITSPLSILDTLSTADILAAVSESTDEGIAMISSWFGLDVNKTLKPGQQSDSKDSDKTTEKSEESKSSKIE